MPLQTSIREHKNFVPLFRAIETAATPEAQSSVSEEVTRKVWL
jgi:hypothetical protein